MLLGVMSRVGRGIGVLDRGGYRRRERGRFGVKLGRLIVTNWDFVAQLCESDELFPNYFGEDLLLLIFAVSLLKYAIHRYRLDGATACCNHRRK